MLNFKGFLPVPWLYIVKKSFINEYQLRFSEGVFFEDVEFTTSMLFYAKKVTVLPFVGYHYRRHASSVTGSVSERKIKDKFTAFLKIKSFLVRKGSFQYYQSLYISRFLTFCVFTSFIDYFSLSRKDRNEELDGYMNEIRNSDVLNTENLQFIRNIGLSLSKDKEKSTRKFYLRAYSGLSSIKNRYSFYRIIFRSFHLFKKIIQ